MPVLTRAVLNLSTSSRLLESDTVGLLESLLYIEVGIAQSQCELLVKCRVVSLFGLFFSSCVAYKSRKCNHDNYDRQAF